MPLETQSSSPSASLTALDCHLNTDDSLVLNTKLSYFKFSNKAIRAVDLYNCSQLQEIDLTCSIQEEIHIAIQNCPQLAIIRLPLTSKAYIHLDAGNLKPQLQIEGGVTHVDACWNGGRFLQQHHKNRWHQVTIGSFNESMLLTPTSLSQDESFSKLVVVSELNQSVSELWLDCDNFKGQLDLTFVGARYLQKLNLTNNEKGVNSLSVIQADQLLAVDVLGKGPLSFCVLDECKNFNNISIQGPVHSFKIASCGMSRAKENQLSALRIQAQVKDVILSDCSFTDLVLSHHAKIQFIRCLNLKNVELPNGTTVACDGYLPPTLVGLSEVIINESIIKQALPDVLKGDLAAWQLMKKILPMASEKEWVSLALRTLLEALEAGMDASEVWYVRNHMYIVNQRRGKKIPEVGLRQMKKYPISWSWKMDEDLAEEGWYADWLIVKKCIEKNVNKVPEFINVMSHKLHASVDSDVFLLDWICKKIRQSDSIALECLMGAVKKAEAQYSYFRTNTYIVNRAKLFLFSNFSPTPDFLPRFTIFQNLCFQVAKKNSDPIELLQLLAKSFTQNPVKNRMWLLDLISRPPESLVDVPAYLVPDQLTKSHFIVMAKSLLLTGQLEL